MLATRRLQVYFPSGQGTALRQSTKSDCQN
uniref:Uncharacterized protein n=1 Tax=Anguilla anguilla TaxID=7936 RepID=A0A0E9PFW5_ANGAN